MMEQVNDYESLYMNNGKVPKGEISFLEMERKRLIECISFKMRSGDQHYPLIKSMKANNCSNYFKIRYTKVYSEILKSDITYLKIVLLLYENSGNTSWRM
jgi:hypothetical protein